VEEPVQDLDPKDGEQGGDERGEDAPGKDEYGRRDEAEKRSDQRNAPEPARQELDVPSTGIRRYGREERDLRLERSEDPYLPAPRRSVCTFDIVPPMSAPTMSSRNGPSLARMPGFLRS